MKKFRIALTLVMSVIFIFSSYKIVSYFFERKKADDYYNKFIDDVTVSSDETSVSSNGGSDISENYDINIEIDFDILFSECKDAVGWIYSPGTVINYPVVKGNDNNYYLDKLPNGKKNQSGSIFVDYRNNLAAEDLNYIIYGHHMRNNTMFGSLLEYKKQDYYEKHPTIYFLTPERKYIIELYASFVTSTNEKIYSLEHTEKTLEEYMKEVKEKSDFKTDLEYNRGERIVTLSTCSYEFKDARYVVVGIIKEYRR